MSTTFNATQYLCDISASFSQSFLFQIDATGSIEVQLPDQTFTSNWTPVIDAFVTANGYSEMTQSYLRFIENTVSGSVAYNIPDGVASWTFNVGSFCLPPTSSA